MRVSSALVVASFLTGSGWLLCTTSRPGVQTCDIRASPSSWGLERVWISGLYFRAAPSEVSAHAPSDRPGPQRTCRAGEDAVHAEVLSTSGVVLDSAIAGCILPNGAVPTASSVERGIDDGHAALGADLAFPPDAETVRLVLGRKPVFEMNLIAEEFRLALRVTQGGPNRTGYETALARDIDEFELALTQDDDLRAADVLVGDLCGALMTRVATSGHAPWATAIRAAERRLGRSLLPPPPPPAPPPPSGLWDEWVERIFRPKAG